MFSILACAHACMCAHVKAYFLQCSLWCCSLWHIIFSKLWTRKGNLVIMASHPALILSSLSKLSLCTITDILHYWSLNELLFLSGPSLLYHLLVIYFTVNCSKLLFCAICITPIKCFKICNFHSILPILVSLVLTLLDFQDLSNYVINYCWFNKRKIIY